MSYKGIFFDYDFTLGDSSVPIHYGFCRGFEDMGLPAPAMEQVRPTIGMTLQDAFALITGDGDRAKGDLFYHRFQVAVEDLADEAGRRVMIEKSCLLPGAAELLEVLRGAGVSTAIVSTKKSRTIRAILTHCGVTPPAVIIGGGDVSAVKPDPEGLGLAMDRLGLAPHEVLFCGDTVIDAMAARNAGVDFCPVLNGTTPREAFDGLPRVFMAEDLFALREWLGV